MSFWSLKFSQKTNLKTQIFDQAHWGKKNLFLFLGGLKKPKCPFEINWPLGAPFLILFFTAGSWEKGIKNGAARKRFKRLLFFVFQQRKAPASYKSAGQLPREREVKELKIYVDKKYETIILPIWGIPVPFHICTIKNISTSIEGE